MVMTTPRRLSLGSGLVAVLLGAAALVVGPAATPAAACSCLPASDEEHFASAHAVFRATVLGVQAPPVGPGWSSDDPVTWMFAVSEVFKGDAAPIQPVASVATGASCGLEIPQEGEFFVFVGRRENGDYAAGLCGGTRSTAAGPLAVASLLPTTTVAPAPTPTTPTTVAPEPEPEPEPEPTTSTVTVTVTVAPTTVPAILEQAAIRAATPVPSADDDDGGGGLSLALVAVAVGAVLAVGGVGVLRLRRRG